MLRVRQATSTSEAENYTLHTTENAPVIFDGSIFSTEGGNRMGHWQTGSRMCDRYDRSTRTQELLLRNTILANVAEWWKPAGPFSAPRGHDIQVTAPKKRGICSPGEFAGIRASVDVCGASPNSSFSLQKKGDRDYDISPNGEEGRAAYTSD